MQLEGQSTDIGPADTFASIEAPELSDAPSWDATVFRANASALAEVDRLARTGGVIAYAVELVGRAGLLQRTLTSCRSKPAPMTSWPGAPTALDTSLSAGAAVGIEPDADSLARLAALQAAPWRDVVSS